MGRLLLLLPVMGVLGLAPTAVEAQPEQSTKYVYYAIGGGSASEIYAAMLRRGPHVHGKKAYAASSAATSHNGSLVQAESCVVKNYRLKIDFVIRLPKIANESALPAADRSRWRQFAQFLKRHEETHRSIWLACAQNLETKVRAIKAASCSDVDARIDRLWDQMRQSCDRKHDAFDAAEQRRLLQHPFVRQVLSRQTRESQAAAP
jgi:predicted secreted Zn-dependent protease